MFPTCAMQVQPGFKEVRYFCPRDAGLALITSKKSRHPQREAGLAPRLGFPQFSGVVGVYLAVIS